MAMARSALRGVIVAPPGRKLVVSDLSNIEGRVLAWLAGERWKLAGFVARDTDPDDVPDLYVQTYARVFGVDIASVTPAQRQIGKVLELAFGFGGGVGALLSAAALYSIDLDALVHSAYDALPTQTLSRARDSRAWFTSNKRNLFALAALAERTWLVCESIKTMWRDAHPSTVAFWRSCEVNYRRAVEDSGLIHAPTEHLIYQCADNWLCVKLPSERYLCYPSPRVADDGTLSYMGVDAYTRKWQRIETYGAKIAENATQTVARDVMAHSMPLAEAAGFSIVLTTHDELLTEAPDHVSHNTAAQLSQVLAARPPWATGLPLAAAGFEAYRYRKG